MHSLLTTLVRHSWLPILLVFTLLIGLDLFNSYIWPAMPTLLHYALYWVVLTALFVVLSEFNWRQYSIDELQLLTRLFVAGVVLGLSLAIYRGVTQWELWTLFNLAAEPLRSGLYAVLIGWIVSNIQRESITNY